MCVNTSELNPCHLLHSTVHRQHQWKRPKVRIHRLNRRRRRGSKEAKEKARVKAWKREMKINNMKLYIENKSIIEENEKLRKKALFLHQENTALQSQLRKVSRSRHNHLPHHNNKH